MMEQLLQITTVPMKYELKVTHATYNYSSKQSQVETARTPGGYHMQSRRASLSLDTDAARNSVCPDTATSIRQFAQKGRQMAQNFIGEQSKEAAMLANSLPGQDIVGDAVRQRTIEEKQFGLGFIPTTGPEITYHEPNLEVEYEKDKLKFDVRVHNGDVEYVPGDVSVNITQWPDVVIEYIGKPMYIPPRDDGPQAFTARA